MGLGDLDEVTMKLLDRVRETDPELARRVLAFRMFSAPAERKTAPKHVYFIRAASSGLIKIGAASKPQERLKTLATGSAEPLELVAVWHDAGLAGEKEMHELFAAQRSHGEWFHPSEELDAAMAVVS